MTSSQTLIALEVTTEIDGVETVMRYEFPRPIGPTRWKAEIRGDLDPNEDLYSFESDEKFHLPHRTFRLNLESDGEMIVRVIKPIPTGGDDERQERQHS